VNHFTITLNVLEQFLMLPNMKVKQPAEENTKCECN